MRGNIRQLFRCAPIVVLAISFASAAWGQPARLIEAAKKEGKVVWYTSLNINDSNALLARFEQKYPGIKSELLRAGSEQLLNRVLTEDTAGRSAMDVVNLTTINALKRRNLLQAHRSPEFAAFPNQFKDPDGYWATLYNIYYVLGYNTKMVSPKDAPKNWDDFVNPKWKGKIGMDQEEYEWYAGTIKAWGKEKALKFHHALAQQEIHWNRGHTMVAQLMAAGEFPLGIIYAHRTESMKKAGAPIDWAKTADPVFVTISPVAVAAKAHNPNAARLLMDFILSKEGQTILRGANRISGRLDIEPLVPDMNPAKLKLFAIDSGVAEELNRYSKEFREIYFKN
ncbi:MAG TPA: extracellular solute-binding protein [Candidatus Binatia bacterium]|jgi:iron(III) transport system substrate-binding protein